ncbi:MAG: hypothetical protein ACJ8F3_01605 [Xanthobacteraceae bacterium]
MTALAVCSPSKSAIYCYVALLSSAYVILLGHTPLTIVSSGQFLDHFWVTQAQSLAGGDWLGSFGEHTLLNGPGYPLFLAAVHWLGISLSLADACFHALAVITLVCALHPLHRSFWISGILLPLLLWHPVLLTADLRRVVPESIYSSQLLLFFGLLISALRSVGPSARPVLAMLAGVLGGWIWVSSEYTLIWIFALIPFLIFAGLKATAEKSLPKLVGTLLLTCAGYLAVQVAIRSENWHAYGAFVATEGVAEMRHTTRAQIVNGVRERAPTMFGVLMLTNPDLPLNPSVGPSRGMESQLRFLNYPPHTPLPETQLQPVTYSLSGWYYKSGTDWLNLQVKKKDGMETWVRLQRMPSPDLVQAFNDAHAANQRFLVATFCVDSCIVEIQAAGAAEVRSLEELRGAPLGFKVGTGYVHFDSVTRAADPALETVRTEAVANSVRELVMANYKFVSVPIACIGAVVFAFLGLFRARRALMNECYMVALTCWLGVLLHTAWITLIDITSFPALNPMHLGPSYFMMITAAVLSCAAWLQLAWDREIPVADRHSIDGSARMAIERATPPIT